MLTRNRNGVSHTPTRTHEIKTIKFSSGSWARHYFPFVAALCAQGNNIGGKQCQIYRGHFPFPKTVCDLWSSHTIYALNGKPLWKILPLQPSQAKPSHCHWWEENAKKRQNNFNDVGKRYFVFSACIAWANDVPPHNRRWKFQEHHLIVDSYAVCSHQLNRNRPCPRQAHT